MKRSVNQPTGRLHLYGGIYLREIRTPDAGTLIPQHRHKWDHITYLAAGAVRVWRDDQLLGDYIAPAAIRIAADTAHRFLTLGPDSLILCVHATDTVEIELAGEQHLELED